MELTEFFTLGLYNCRHCCSVVPFFCNKKNITAIIKKKKNNWKMGPSENGPAILTRPHLLHHGRKKKMEFSSYVY